MFNPKYSRQKEALQEFLEPQVETLSRETGFVQRASKLNGVVFVKALVLSWLERPTGTLNEITQSCKELGVAISEPGLQQRMNARAVALMQGLFEAGLRQLPKAIRLPEGVLSRFKGIYLLDSTTLTLPNQLKGLFAGAGSAAAVKIRLSFDYRRGSIEALEVVAGRAADQNCQQHLELAGRGTLHLFDLGFFKQQVFEALAGVGAYFISRLHLQTALYWRTDTSQALDLSTLLMASGDGPTDLDVALGQRVRLPVRLIFQKLPPLVVVERTRKAKRAASKRGQPCSARHLALLAWSVYITNIPRDWLNASQIMLIYSVRWQIELVFKLWKSQACLDVIGNCGSHRFLCQLYARLLGLLIFQWMLMDTPFTPDHELSLPKAFAVLQRYAARLRRAMSLDWSAVTALLQHLASDFQRFALKQKRRKSPSTLARLLASGA